MEDYNLIKYKWDIGVYDLQQMIQFVKNDILNKQQFFDITRHNYDGINKVRYQKSIDLKTKKNNSII